MAKVAGIKRSNRAKLVPKEADTSVIADTLSLMLREVMRDGVKPDTLRVSVETASQDDGFWQLRAGVHLSE